MTSVSLPESLRTIGAWAFQFNELTEVTIPDGVTTIGNTAFYQNRLSEVTIPGTIAVIEGTVFTDNRLTKVEIPAGVTEIKAAAFRDNPLSEVTIAGTVESILEDAFRPEGVPAAPPLNVYFEGDAPALENDPFGPSGYLSVSTLYYSEGAAGFTDPLAGYQTRLWEHIVSFDSGAGTSVPPREVGHGGTLSELAVPEREGYSFTGWFASAEDAEAGESPFDLDTAITGDLTLYAGWERVPDPAPEPPENTHPPGGTAAPPTTKGPVVTTGLAKTGGDPQMGLLGAAGVLTLLGALAWGARRRAPDSAAHR